MDGLCLALLSPQERERLDEIAAQTSAAFEALGSILQSTGDDKRIARNAHGGIYSHAVNLIRNEYATTLL